MTSYKNNGREDSVTDISLYRDLSNCDKFAPIRDYNSPLALITGMVRLLYVISKDISITVFA